MIISRPNNVKPYGDGPWCTRPNIHRPYHSPTKCSTKPETISSAAPQPETSNVTQTSWDRELSRLGRLVVRPITRTDTQAAGVVLTRAFAGSAEAVLLGDVLKDIESLVPSSDPTGDTTHDTGDPNPPKELFLVARLYPSDPRVAALPPGQDSRLVGTASLSLSHDSQPIRRLPRVNLPPDNAAYISNMAVDPRVRRQGVARALLACCEDAARRAGRQEVWLHVREADAAARALYDGQGFVAVGKDSWLDTMKTGMRPRVLMRRAL